MSIHGRPRPCPDQPPVSQRSLEKATIRRDMAAVPDKVARQLLRRFNAYTEKMLSRFATGHLVGVDRADLRAIAHVAIIEAYTLYQDKRGASLSSWVHRVVRWRVSEAVVIARAGGREVHGREFTQGAAPFGDGTPGYPPHHQRGSNKSEVRELRESATPSLQVQWLRATLRRHFTAEERALILGEVPVPRDPKARARFKFRRHKAREKLMRIALEAGVITRTRDHDRAHYVVRLTGDVPLKTG